MHIHIHIDIDIHIHKHTHTHTATHGFVSKPEAQSTNHVFSLVSPLHNPCNKLLLPFKPFFVSPSKHTCFLTSKVLSPRASGCVLFEGARFLVVKRNYKEHRKSTFGTCPLEKTHPSVSPPGPNSDVPTSAFAGCRGNSSRRPGSTPSSL